MNKFLEVSLMTLWLQLASKLGLIVIEMGRPKFRGHVNEKCSSETQFENIITDFCFLTCASP